MRAKHSSLNVFQCMLKGNNTTKKHNNKGHPSISRYLTRLMDIVRCCSVRKVSMVESWISKEVTMTRARYRQLSRGSGSGLSSCKVF